MVARSVVLVFVVALAAAQTGSAAVAPSSLPPLGTCPGELDARAAAGSQLNSLHCLVNAVRARRGLRRLRLVSPLVRSSAFRADAIVRCRQFSHTPCGQPFGAVFRRVGYSGRGVAVGETLAFASNATPRWTVDAWLRSPAHRRVLLASSWRDFGGVNVNASALFGAQSRLWVAQFGRRG